MKKLAGKPERTGNDAKEREFNAMEREKTGKNATYKRLKPQTRKATQNTNNKFAAPRDKPKTNSSSNIYKSEIFPNPKLPLYRNTSFIGIQRGRGSAK